MTSGKATDFIYNDLLRDIDTFTPEVLGEGRILFASFPGVPLASLLFDPTHPPAPMWRKLPGMSFTGSFFRLLTPFMKRHATFRFCLSDHQGEAYQIQDLCHFDEALWSVDALRELERLEPTGKECRMAYVLGEMDGLLHFNEAGDSFEILFHGKDGLWDDIRLALQGDESAVP